MFEALVYQTVKKTGEPFLIFKEDSLELLSKNMDVNIEFIKKIYYKRNKKKINITIRKIYNL